MTKDLHTHTLELVREERRLTGLVIENLQKISDLNLFLEMGYSSLFTYCTRALGYSEACAYRRIQAVKVARQLPEVKEKLNSGVINLTNLSMAQSLITSATLSLEEKREVLHKIENCTKRQAEIALAQLGRTPNGPGLGQEKLTFRNGNEALLQLQVSKQTIEKLDRLKKLRSHKNPNMTYSDLVDDLCDCLLRKIDPLEQKTDRTKNSKSTLIRSARSTTHNNRRFISAKLKRAVWQRDNGQCTFVDPQTMNRCESMHLLQIDHIKPVFLGGEASHNNLRLLCHAHHKFRDKDF